MEGGTMSEEDPCVDPECDGLMEFPPVENCSCFISAPCSQCTGNQLICNKCGMNEKEAEGFKAVAT